jgi:PAS domain S-box-containing protein
MERFSSKAKQTDKSSNDNIQDAKNEKGKNGHTFELQRVNKELQKAETKIKKLNHLYAFISQINQKIVRVKDEATLFKNACSMALEFGRFKMAWIGIFDHALERINIVEQCGVPQNELQLFADASNQNMGPQNYVLLNGTYYVSNNIENDIQVESQMSFALMYGMHSYMVMPIKKAGIIIGTLNLYSTEPNFSGKEELELLVEVSGDISFALDMFEKDRAHKNEEAEIKASEILYHSLFDNMLEGFARCKMIYENGLPHDFVYLNVNRAFESLTGLQNVTGKNVTEVIPSFTLDNPEVLEAYSRVSLTGNPERIETYMKSLEMWLDISIYSIEKGYFTAVFDVITEKKNADEKLANSEKHFRALIEHGADMTCLTDVDGSVKYGSPSIKKGLGYTTQEFLLKYPYQLIHPDDIDSYLKKRDKLLGTPGKSFMFEQRRLHKNGSWIWCEGTITNLLNAPGIYALVTNFRNITEQKQAHDAMLNINNELEERVSIRTGELLEANKALEAFSYSVSHDLRSPVRSVVGFAKILEKNHSDEMSADAKELFSHIQESGKRMNAIIDDLLSFAKWGKEKLQLTEVDMTALFQHVWKNTMLESPHHAILEIEQLPMVQADMALIRQVVVNLISNAVKYSSKKENPVVKVGFEVKGGEVVFHVSDNGAGFDMQHYDRLFGAFMRLHGVDDFEGTGIGLALIKTIIEKHNGHVWAVGKVNEGATFYFALPIV